MTNNKKQVVFTNEIIYERNISDRIWPRFLQAQLDSNIEEAWLSVKCYFLFTQQWYQEQSPAVIKKIRQIKTTIGKPKTVGQAKNEAQIKAKAWIDIETVWCQISNNLEDYGIFKRNFTHDNNALALPGRNK
jgi:hypothetical protein